MSGKAVAGPPDVGENAGLRRIAVEASIVDFCSEVRLRQEYYNAGDEPIEAVFTFPLRASAAVTGLVITNGDKRLVGKIQEASQAKEAYDNAVKAGKTGVLVKEVSEDMLQCMVGNIAPNGTLVVELTYVEELSVEEDNLRFKVPLTIIPRYVGREAATRAHAQAAAAAVGSIQLDFSADVSMSMPVHDVTSPTHSVGSILDPDGHHGTVTLDESVVIDRDLDLLFILEDRTDEEKRNPLVVVEEHPELHSKAVLVSLFPEIKQTTGKCETILLIDRSASMRGSRIEMAIAALQLFLRSLPAGCLFNLVSFGSKHAKLFDHSVPYAKDTLDTATSYVDCIKADMGGTNILDPLTAILQVPKSSDVEHRSVIFLTDGAVSNTDGVLALAAKHKEETRIFTLGIGSGCSTALVEGLASRSKGMAEFVVEREPLNAKVVRQLKWSMQYGLTDISIQWRHPLMSHYAALGATCIYRGDRLLIYNIQVDEDVAAAMKEVAFKISALDGDGQRFESEVDYECNPARVLKGDLIHRLGTKALVKEKDPGVAKHLSLRYGVASQQCSFVVVDPSSGGQVRSVTVDRSAPLPSKGKKKKKAKFGLFSSRSGAADSNKIGGPTLFRHASHIGWDMSTQINHCIHILAVGDRSPPSSPASSHARGPSPPRAPPLCDATGPPPPIPPAASSGPPRSPRSAPPPCPGRPRPPAGANSGPPPRPPPPSKEADQGRKSATRSTSASPRMSLDAIIRLQAFDGTWTLSDASRLLGTGEAAILAAVKSSDIDDALKDNKALLGTALVAAFIMSNFASKLGDWELVVAKAERWVASVAGPAAPSPRTLVYKIAALC